MTRQLKTPDQLWDEYAKIIPPDAPRTQRNETKRAFSAGMYVVMQFMKALGDMVGDMELSEDESVAAIERFGNAVEVIVIGMIQEDERSH